MPAADRFFATILFTDIAGSTARAAELGDRHWRDLLHEHHDRVRREVARHAGKERNTAGDGFLVTFESPESAVRCAAAIRDAVEDLALRVRCGLHAGEVQRVGDDVGGIAVHIAARVAARAAAGEVLASGTVRDVVSGSGLRFVDRGTRRLKGVDGTWRLYALASDSATAPTSWADRFRGRRPRVAAAAGAAAVVAAAAVWWGGGSVPSADDRGGLVTPSPAVAAPSVAVLPFANASPDPGDEYFSDGLTEELISALSGIEGLRVPGRTSSFAFKDSLQDVRRIGAALGVGHVLEGSVRRSSNRLRIDARLVSAADGYRVWSETYDRELADAIEIQEEIATAIAHALEVELVDQPLPGGGPASRATNPVAYDHYLKALHFSHSPTPEGVEESIAWYREAIRADPAFAPAHAGLARAYHLLGNRFGAGQSTYLPLAKAAAEEAIRLDDGLAESQLALGMVKAWWDRDHAGAGRAFRRTIELRPGWAEAYHSHAVYLAYMLRYDDAVASIQRAAALDPLSDFYATDVGAILMLTRRYEEAIAHFQQMLGRRPDHARSWLLLGRTYVALGRHEEAIEAFERAQGLPGGDAAKAAWLGHVYALAGRRGEALSLLERVESFERGRNLRATDIAALKLALGLRDEALERLERAERERDLDPVPLQLDSRLDPLRGDSRFRAIVARMGLPQERG